MRSRRPRYRHTSMWALLLLSALPSSAFAGEPEVRSALRPLADLMTGLRSIHLHAKGVLEAAGGSPSSTRSAGSVEYTYWASGRKYMIGVSTAGDLPIAPDFEVAFDGRQFQLFLVRDGILSVRKDDSPALPVSLPNPFLLFLDYANVVDDGCSGCMPRVADLAAKGRQLLQPITTQIDSGESSAPGGMLKVRLPGRAEHGTAYDHLLSFEKVGAGWRLRDSKRITRDGRTMLEVRYDDFVRTGPNQEFEIPRHLTAEVYDLDAGGKLSMHLEYFVDTLEVNADLPNARFSLDWDKARSIWDSDSNMFIKGGH
jgi:hypothetical protein